MRGLGLGLVAASAVIVVLATASTSSARFAARTDNDTNLWQAATLDLDVRSGRQLFLDADGLYPGLELQNCVVVRYGGSIRADIHLRTVDRSGSLPRFFDVEVEAGRGDATDCSDFVGDRTLYTGRLDGLASGGDLLLATNVGDGHTVTLRVSGRLIDTNAAQGTVGRYDAVVEATPS